MEGYIHSIETMGTVDGPGLRYVVFTSGCPLRCKYCHNPDTWEMEKGKIKSCSAIIEDFKKYRPYLKNGGLTVSGGEPLLQIDFVTELFRLAKKSGIHTCLDTSGATFTDKGKRGEKFKKLCAFTDLVLLDIKHINPEVYQDLCGGDLNDSLGFLNFLSKETRCDIWIRHVILKGYTYNTKDLYKLGFYLGAYKNIKALDVLPYHDMAKKKYEKLGMDYPLKELKSMSKEQAKNARITIEAGMRDKLLGNKPKF